MGAAPVKRVVAFAAALLALPALAARPEFAVDYRVAFEPDKGTAHVVIATAPIDGRLIRLTTRLDPDRYTGVKGDGTLERDGDQVVWSPPRKGGTLQYRVRVDHRRRGDGFDARMTGDWVLLRGDYGFVLDRRPGESSGRFYFSIGQAF